MDDVTDEPIEVETDPDDPRPWIRDYVVCSAVQGDFGSPSAVAVVERVQRDGATDPADVAYLVRAAGEVDAETPIQDTAANAAKLAERAGAGRVVLDGTVCGAPMLRTWDSAVEMPRRFTALRIGDREPPELGGTHRFPLVPVSRLDLLGAVRVAHDRAGGLLYGRHALAARAALAEYKAQLPNLTPEEEEWEPPPTWHIVLAMAIGVWTLMELPPEVGEFPRRDLDWQVSDRYRFDRRKVRDNTLQIEAEQAADADPGGRLPNLRWFMRSQHPADETELARDGRRKFVWLR